MSNQIVITSGAKVRNLDGVLTGTSGIVGSVGFGTANGVATLDSSGKVPLSQLPASVITYLGTWNAATNTPTLTNGVGDVGDLYICNVAGTVNFGAGPITFAVGDWVIYSGTTWEKSGGASGTVTSVAMTVPTGLSVTGSPITTSGTLAVSLSSGYTIPTTSFLSGLVPYTGATQTVDLGSYDLNARGIKVNGTAGSGHVDFKHQSGTPTGSASSTTMFADTNGNMAWKNDHNYITTLASNANTADRTYTFPNASGTIALTSDIPSLSGYVPYIGATTNVDLGSKDLVTRRIYLNTNNEGIYAKDLAGTTLYQILVLNTSNKVSIDQNGLGTIFGGTIGNGTYTYTLPSATGTLALTSDIPSLANYVTTNTNQSITGIKTFTNEQLFSNGLTINGGYLTFADSGFSSTLDTTTLTASRAILLPNASGTLALTSDLSSYVTLASNQTVTGLKTFTNDQTFNGNIIGTTGYFTTNLVVGTSAGSSYKLDVTGNSRFTSDIRLDNGAADGAQLVLASSGFSDWNIDNFSGNFRWYYGATERMRLTNGGVLGIGVTPASQNAGAYGGSAEFGGIIRIQGSGGRYFTSGNGLEMSYNSIYSYNRGTSAYNDLGINDSITVKGAGNVGIGTSSPGNTLPSGAGWGYASRKVLEISSSDNNGNTGVFLRRPDLNVGLDLWSDNYYGDAYIDERYPGNIIFRNNTASSATERMRITSGGNVLIGTTTDTGNARLHLATPGSCTQYFDTTAYGGGNAFIMQIKNNPVNGNFYIQDASTGNGVYISKGGTSWTGVSDERLKTDLIEISDATNKVSQLRALTGRFKTDEEGKSRSFLIAQDVLNVFPEAVNYDEENDVYGIQYTDVIPLLVKAIQEQQEIINNLSAKVTALENKIN